MMVAVESVTTCEEARLSVPPPSWSRIGFSLFLSLGQAGRRVVTDGEGWRWSSVSHLITTSQMLTSISPPDLSNISAMVSPLNSRGLTQKFWENSLFACREKIFKWPLYWADRPTLWSPSRESRTLSREQEQGTWFLVDTNCSISGTIRVWPELFNRKLFLS